MVKTKGIERTVANWKGSAAVIPQRYKDGVSAVSNFKGASLEGDELYKKKIQEAVAKDSRRKGIEKMPESKYKDGALNKGAVRIGPGIAAAESDFRSGMSKVISTIESVSLPPKTGDIDTDIINRVGGIAKALRAMKEA